MLKEDRLGHYIYQALLQADIMNGLKVSARKIMELSADAGTKLMEKWRGRTCDNFKK